MVKAISPSLSNMNLRLSSLEGLKCLQFDRTSEITYFSYGAMHRFVCILAHTHKYIHITYINTHQYYRALYQWQGLSETEIPSATGFMRHTHRAHTWIWVCVCIFKIHLYMCDLCHALFMLTINNVRDIHDCNRRNYVLICICMYVCK